MMARKGKADMDGAAEKTASLDVPLIEGKSSGYCMALSEMEPGARHALSIGNATASTFGGAHSDMNERVAALRDLSAQVAAGDLSTLSNTLTAQALTLDATFTNLLAMALRQRDLAAVDRIYRLAFKAQSQARATVEALAKMHQPREQTVHHRHYHISQDGKAVFVEHAYGGQGNGSFGEQPYEAGSAGVFGASAALPSPKPVGQPVPVASDQGAEAVPPARLRPRKRRTEG